MQNMDIAQVEFVVEELEARFEMEAVPSGVESPDWTCTCSISDK
ncbi:hypothetical protein [Duganella guangzhouensis]|nr:hypothetical protein [Duganella guangzhouensis]